MGQLLLKSKEHLSISEKLQLSMNFYDEFNLTLNSTKMYLGPFDSWEKKEMSKMTSLLNRLDIELSLKLSKIQAGDLTKAM